MAIIELAHRTDLTLVVAGYRVTTCPPKEQHEKDYDRERQANDAGALREIEPSEARLSLLLLFFGKSGQKRLPNASEFSCGFNFPYSTKLLPRAASYNSSLGITRPNAGGARLRLRTRHTPAPYPPI